MFVVEKTMPNTTGDQEPGWIQPVNSLNISYFKEIESAYSGKTSRITAYSMSQSIYSSTDEDGNPQDPHQLYDPLLNGYHINEISKGENCFLNLVPDCDNEDKTKMYSHMSSHLYHS